ncbi:heme A synthase, partial [Bacillus sp. SRB_28]
ILSFVFLGAQALMGAAAVVWGQMPAVIAIHFCISLILFASVILLTCLIFENDKKFDARALIIDKKMK